MKKLNYYEIGKGIIEETIGFNAEMYKNVTIKDYSEELIFEIGALFIDNHPEAILDYLKWSFALIDDCSGETYDIMFDVVNKATRKQNDNFYWNHYLEEFVPSEFLNNACDMLENELPNFSDYELKHNLGDYISLSINDKQYKILNDREQYIVRDEEKDIYYPKTYKELLALLYELKYSKKISDISIERMLETSTYLNSAKNLLVQKTTILDSKKNVINSKVQVFDLFNNSELLDIDEILKDYVNDNNWNKINEFTTLIK